MQPLPNSLTAVRAFDAAARHMSCSRAAEELFLTQSAVSKQLQSLEENLGVQLFVRIHQGLTLTDAGLAYWDGVRPALHMLAEAASRARALHCDKQIINLVVPPALCQKWLIPRLGEFLGRHPDVKVQFMPRSSGDFKYSASTAEIRGGRFTPPGVQVQYLFGREIHAICSPTLVKNLKKRPGLSATELMSYQLFEHTRMPQIWERWLSLRAITGYDARSIQRFEHFSVMIPALVAGMGIALMPRCLVEEELKQGSLRLLFDEPMSTEYGYYLLRQKEAAPSEALKCFTEWLLKAAGAQP